jgi:2-keto-4-pentenoate hydratase/2-oxohepta-3-ene-1,7-dioic acid hydratase in catechol pathway
MPARVFRYDDHGTARYAVDHDGAVHELTGDLFGRFVPGKRLAADPTALPLLAPVMPSKIVCVGLNYKDHAAEQNKPLPAEPLIFIKPATSVIGPGQPIRMAPGIGRVDHEAELGIVIGRRAHRVSRADAWGCVLGLICVNDVTARDLQNKGAQYTRAKGFDTFAPIGPCIALASNGSVRERLQEGADGLSVEGWVNGVRRQASDTSHLIFPIEQLIAFITFIMTLEPGDIISTGTPAGIGPLADGDSVTVKVEDVGELSNTVVAEVQEPL